MYSSLFSILKALLFFLLYLLVIDLNSLIILIVINLYLRKQTRFFLKSHQYILKYFQLAICEVLMGPQRSVCSNFYCMVDRNASYLEILSLYYLLKMQALKYNYLLLNSEANCEVWTIFLKKCKERICWDHLLQYFLQLILFPVVLYEACAFIEFNLEMVLCNLINWQ